MCLALEMTLMTGRTIAPMLQGRKDTLRTRPE
jgi:hypothetical protein